MARDESGLDKQQRRHTEVLKTAAQIFHDHGYDGSSMQQIADSLGILKGSLYHYTRSKEDLLYEVIKESHEAALANVEACKNLSGTATERLETFIEGHINIMLRDQIGFSIYVRDSASLSTDRRREVQSERNAYRDYVIELVRAGQENGELRKDVDAGLAALGLLGMLNWAYQWYRPRGKYSAATIVSTFTDLTLGGLRSHA